MFLPTTLLSKLRNLLHLLTVFHYYVSQHYFSWNLIFLFIWRNVSLNINIYYFSFIISNSSFFSSILYIIISDFLPFSCNSVINNKTFTIFLSSFFLSSRTFCRSLSWQLSFVLFKRNTLSSFKCPFFCYS